MDEKKDLQSRFDISSNLFHIEIAHACVLLRKLLIYFGQAEYSNLVYFQWWIQGGTTDDMFK